MNHRYARTSGRYRSRRAWASPVSMRRLAAPVKVVAAIAVLAVLAVGIGTATMPMLGGAVLGAGFGQSTPASEWERGFVPYLYQTDPSWAGEPYAGGTVEENGCGPTCLSMVYVSLTGKKDLDPAAMAAFSERGGHVDSGMTSWTLMTLGAAELGLASEELPADEGAVLSALFQGKPVVCSVGPGDFTSTGHFIVLAGVNDSGGVLVRNPNSEEGSHRAWDIERILSQCLNLWAFSAA